MDPVVTLVRDTVIPETGRLVNDAVETVPDDVKDWVGEGTLCVFSAKIQNFFAPWLFVNEWPQYGLVWMWTHGNVNFRPQKLSYGL